jgi:hypothetical protein
LKLIRFFTKILLIALVPLLAINELHKADSVAKSRSVNDYLATFIDKMHLLNTMPSPRLILMSGSSMAFGVDSDLLSRELETPVVNAALHGNLGSKFMMEQLKATVKKGDIVLITLEYSTTSQGKYEEQLIAADFYPPAQKWINFNSFWEEFYAYITHKVSSFRLWISQFWTGSQSKPISSNLESTVKHFDKNGDFIGQLENPKPVFDSPELSAGIDFGQQIKDLNDFGVFAKQKGVSVLFTFPSYTESGFEKNMTAVKKIEQEYRTHLKFPILGSPENSVLDNSFFFDNFYHLNTQGRKIFTSRLIQLLEQEGI